MNTLGIDFGTTKTLIATVDKRSGKAETIRLGRAADELPTTIHVDCHRQFLFGDDADDQLSLDPENYIRRVKRSLGTTRDFVLGGHRFTAVELVSAFLKHVKDRVESEHFHGSVTNAVITVPAKFGPSARNALASAATLAGFTHVELLDEPIAAGMAFLEEKEDSELGDEILVFDWGGGTLDIALVERPKDQWNINHDLLEGDPDLGGEDIDEALLDAINEALVSTGQKSIQKSDTENYPLLYRRIVELKRLLSKKEKHAFTHQTSTYRFPFECSRTEFENYISNELNRAFDCLSRWSTKAQAAGKESNRILLVGGTSQILAVRNRFIALGKTPLPWTRSGHAVALGAAIHANQVWAKPVSSNTRTASLEEYRKHLEAAFFDGEISEREHQLLVNKKKELALGEGEATALERQILSRELSEFRPASASGGEQSPIFDISFSPPEYGIFIKIIQQSELMKHESPESTHFPFGIDVVVTNLSGSPVNNVTLRVSRNDGAASTGLLTIARVLDPFERVRLTTMDIQWFFQPGDLVEVGCHGAPHPTWANVVEHDCNFRALPVLPILAAWAPATFKGKILQLAHFGTLKTFNNIVIKTFTGEANLAELKPGIWTNVGWLEFSDSRNLNDSEIIELSCQGYSSSVGILTVAS